MSPDDPSSPDLRQRAEARLEGLSPDGPVSPKEALRALHELEVHQVELQRQNEELLDIRHRLEDTLVKFTDLYDFAPVAYCTLDSSGRITRANLATGRLLGLERARLLGRHFEAYLSRSGRAVLKATLQQVFAGLEPGPFEAVLEWPGVPPVTVLVEATLSHIDPKCRLVMTDLSPLKRAEAQLQESQDRLAKLAHHLPGVVYQYQLFPDGRACFPYASEGLRALFGLAPEAVREDAARAFAVIHPEDLEAVATSIRISASTLQTWRQVFRVQLPGEAVRWVSSLAQPESLPDGSTLWHGFSMDITGRLEGERALAASEQMALLERQRLSEVIWGTNVGTWEWHVQTGETLFNERWAEILGYTLEELAPLSIETWTRLAHPEDLSRSEAALQRCFQGKTDAYECDCRMRHKDGHWVWVLDRGRVVEWGPDGRPVRMSGTHLDITGRKQTELALAEALAFSQQIIASAQEGVVVYDQQGRLALFNPYMETMAGLPAEAVLGKRPEESFPFLRDLGVAQGVQRAMGGDQVHHPPAPWALPETGRSGWFTSTQAPLRDNQGEIIGVIETITDVTELHRAQEQERKLETDLQHAQKLESLGSLAGGVAHDMNNVLAAIQAVAETISLTHSSDEVLLKSVETIQRASARGRDLVKGLTNFARKELREPEALDLNALVREEADLLRRTTLQKVELALELEAGLPWVLGERGPLGGALMNLCVNAVEAMPRGGTLTLRTRTLPDGRVELAVQDDGEGMPSSVLARATEPFFTTKPRGQGTGLGLAMVYGTVKAHGGTMSLQSEPGKGTLAELRLPALPAAAQAEALEETGGPQTASLAILLVDDDELIRASIPAMVEFYGHSVITAAGGQEALDMLEAGLEVQVIILDLNMPGMDGLATLRALRQRHIGLPVILATGHLDAECIRCLQQDGRALSVTKPYTMDELDLKLQEVLALL